MIRLFIILLLVGGCSYTANQLEEVANAVQQQCPTLESITLETGTFTNRTTLRFTDCVWKESP